MATQEEYARHYCFLDKAGFVKYIGLKDKSNGKTVQIDAQDIASPFKEYAAIYGDTICVFNHESSDNLYGLNACALPLVDVVCNKAFDGYSF